MASRHVPFAIALDDPAAMAALARHGLSPEVLQQLQAAILWRRLGWRDPERLSIE